jgi:hypothetical protein
MQEPQPQRVLLSRSSNQLYGNPWPDLSLMNSVQRQLYIDAQNYFTGDGGKRQDRPRAVALLRQVCYDFDAPIPAAARMFASCLETGECVAMDLAEARLLYERSGDTTGVARCARKILNPGSHGHVAPAPAIQPRSQVHHSHHSSHVAAAPQPQFQRLRPSAPRPAARPTALPAHIERIVLQVGDVAALCKLLLFVVSCIFAVFSHRSGCRTKRVHMQHLVRGCHAVQRRRHQLRPHLREVIFRTMPASNIF